MAHQHDPLPAEIVDAFGYAKLAALLSTPAKPVSSKTVFSWKRIKAGIADWRRPTIARLAIDNAISLSPAAMSYLDPDGAVARDAVKSGADLAKAGMKAASAHAERVRKGWTEDAVRYVVNYVAERDDDFMTEEVRKFAYSWGLDHPPSEAAWGQVMRVAVKRDIIRFVGFAAAKNASRHGTPTRLWRRA